MESKEWEPVQGIHTAKLGKWITKYLNETEKLKKYHFYYDHGDSRSKNVAEIKGFYGKEVTKLTRLTDVDIIIAKPNQKILLLLEVEETPQNPQKYIGSVFSILMCNRFAVGLNKNQQYFTTTPDTKLIVAGTLPTKRRLEKVKKVIAPRIRQFQALTDSIQTKNVFFIFRNDISSTMLELKEKIKKFLQSEEHGVYFDMENETNIDDHQRRMSKSEEKSVKGESIMSWEWLNMINWNKFPERISECCVNIAKKVAQEIKNADDVIIRYKASYSFKGSVEGKVITVAKLIPHRSFDEPIILSAFRYGVDDAESYASKFHWKIEKRTVMHERFYISRIPDAWDSEKVANIFAKFLNEDDIAPPKRQVSL